LLVTSNEVLALAREYSAIEASAEESNILLVRTFYCIKEIDRKIGGKIGHKSKRRGLFDESYKLNRWPMRPIVQTTCT